MNEQITEKTITPTLNPSAANRLRRIFRWVEWEAVVWTAGLIFLALGDPYSPQHFTLFLPYYLFGIQSPGYNLGHSVSFLFQGHILESIQVHILGIPAVVILLMRIIKLIRRMISNYPIFVKGATHV
jgi:hypothetical protein